MENNKGSLIILDFCKVFYLDSVVFGMVVLFKKCVKVNGCDVEIVNVKGIVLEVFEIVNFDKMVIIC